MKVKDYARILDKLVSRGESEKALEENVRGFLLYVAENKDVHLAGKIYKELEKAWRTKIRRVDIETGKRVMGSEEQKESMRALFGKGGAAVCVTQRINPRLISGTKITIDDNYQVEASLEGALNQMFNTYG